MTWRLDRDDHEPEFFATEAEADRALWRPRMASTVRHAVVWQDLARYETSEGAA